MCDPFIAFATYLCGLFCGTSLEFLYFLGFRQINVAKIDTNLWDFGNSSFKFQEFDVYYENENVSYNVSIPTESSICRDVDLVIFVVSRPSSFVNRWTIRNAYEKQKVNK